MINVSMVDPESFVPDEQNFNLITRKKSKIFPGTFQRSVKISAKVKELPRMLREAILLRRIAGQSCGDFVATCAAFACNSRWRMSTAFW